LIHELKTWPTAFRAILSGKKTYEIRKNDRNFKVGDHLLLKEYFRDIGEYSGQELKVVVTYMTGGGEWGLPDDLCVMSII
jgi:hypothetical protein